MTVSHWVRTVKSSLAWPSGSDNIARLPQGATLIRTHLGWGFYGDTPASADLLATANNLMVMGICTTVGTGTESVPDPRTAPGDASPPEQRWIYWEGRAPKVQALDAGLTIVAWQDSGNQEPVDSKGMVSAKTIPAGDTLGVWASWSPAYAWDAGGNVNLWYYASLLYHTPT
jgi:hypothetical protein